MEIPSPSTSSSSSSATAAPSTSSSSSSSKATPATDDTKDRTSSTSSSSQQDDTKSKKHVSSDSDSDKESDEKMFECNICLDTAKDAVVSYCGHLFCWPCLYQWLETRPNRQSCPVCKAAISRDKCIPLYGRGGSGADPRSKIPSRPPPTRTEQPDSGRFSWGSNDGNGGFHMSFGIGAFPFGFFASAFNFGGPGATPAGANFMTAQQIEEQEFLSKVFIWVALIFIVWLMLA